MLNNKVILITGGTGSLGRALTRYILDNYKPKKIIIFARDEFKHYEMRKEFGAKLIGDKTLRFMIGDIRDRWRTERAMKGVDICIHTAALKRIDDLEYNPDEAVKTNILGTQNVIEAAGTKNVKIVIGVTTDKAVKPINAYGLSKAMGDRLIINANALYPDTRFILVRYGNVCNSTGSVIPIFKKVIEAGGRIEVTHPEMTRFWITMNEAIETIMVAIQKGEGGETFIPKMLSYFVTDLAQALGGGNYKVVGVRPGEKISEDLITQYDNCYYTGGYYIIYPQIEWRKYNKQGTSLLRFDLSSNTVESMTVKEIKERYETL